MSTLRQLIDTVGPAVVEVVAAPSGLDVEVSDVLVHDPTDPLEPGRGDLVLGVGISSGAEALDLLADLGKREAAGLVVKAHLLDLDLAEMDRGTQPALVSINPGTSWSQVLAWLQSALTHGGFRVGEETLGGLEAGDLFALADAAAELVDAPVTIEDRLSRVLAYSGRQDEADNARAETIVGRRVPERFVKRFEQQGLFAQLQKSSASIYLDDIEEGVLPRLVVAIRAGDELLGSMWAACHQTPTDMQRTAFEDAAKVAALHLLRHRAGADIERRLEADLMAAALQGGGAATSAVARLGLKGDCLTVIAVSIDDDNEEVGESLRMRLRDLLSLQIESLRLRGSAALMGGIVYALLDVAQSERSTETARRLAHTFVDLCKSKLKVLPLVGVGGTANGARNIARSKKEGEAALRVLLAGRCKPPVALIEEVRMQALLLRFGEFADPERDVYDESLRSLIEADRRHGSHYVETLRVFLETFGDVPESSRRLHVHPNTLRYRMSKLQEISGIDLDDPDERLALMILLSAFSEGPTIIPMS